MKTINTKAIKIALAFFAITAVSACKKDYFILPDHAGIDARIWENEGAIQYYLNDTYDVTMPDFPYEFAANNQYYSSDENFMSASDATMKKALGLNGLLLSTDVRYIASKYQGTKGDNKYYDIARSNLAIANLRTSSLSPDVKRKFVGQFYALRAMNYFELARLYGGVPLVLEPQDPDNLTLSGRAKAADLFKAIVNDLDSAMVKLDGVTWNDSNERGKWTKMAAAAYKAKVLLYWASPQFNPVSDGAHPNDPTRWNAAFKASQEAYALCQAGGRSLMANYGDIFLKEGTANNEAIIVRSYSNKLAKRGQSVESKSRPSEEGGAATDAYVPTLNLINAYTMRDGTPIANNATYDPVTFWRNRDPRFAATIVYNGAPWKLSGKTGRKQWAYIGEVVEGSKTKPFYCKRFTDPELGSTGVAIVSDLGGNGFDWIELRLAEVMLNYAEAANETGNISLAKDMVRQIRIRAGIVQGTQDYGLALAGNKDQMRDLILNERMVEFAFEGKRAHDLRRTRRMHLLSGQLLTMQFETLNTAQKTFLETVVGTGRNRDTMNIDYRSNVIKFFKYPYTQLTVAGNGPLSVPEYFYFYPLPSQFLTSSPLLEQTIGWDIGTFDPLK